LAQVRLLAGNKTGVGDILDQTKNTKRFRRKRLFVRLAYYVPTTLLKLVVKIKNRS
jgi:hypothetical protein